MRQGRKRGAAERDAYAACITKAPPRDRSIRAGACGRRALAARRPPTAMRHSDRTPRPAASTAPRSAPTIASRRTRWPALRWPAAAPISASQWRQRPLRPVPGRRLRPSHAGPAYISGALAYGWQDITTDRTVTIAGIDQLRAEFNANALSGPLEGGYRFVAPWMAASASRPMPPPSSPPSICRPMPNRRSSGANTFALAYGAEERDRHAQRTRPAHRQVLGDARLAS